MPSMPYIRGFCSEITKIAEVTTPLRPHQERVVSRIGKEDQPGLVVAHGLGSGKTLTSIAAMGEVKGKKVVVAPASLLDNFRKELTKHVSGSPSPALVSMQRVALSGKVPESEVLVVDEAHRAREVSTRTYKSLKGNQAEKRLLLTASPFYNRPSDIAALVNLAAGENVLPTNQSDFAQKYITNKKTKPSLWGRIRGIRPGSTPVLNRRQKKELRKVFDKWVDYHPGMTDEYPSVTHEKVRVPMSKEQYKIYKSLMGDAPSWLRYKIRKKMPPSKQESRDLNAFMTGLRQVSLSTAPYITEGESSESKVEAAFSNLKKTLKSDKRNKVVVYSNYLTAGIDPYKKRLEAAKIPYGEFSGKMKKKDRDQTIRDYNDGKLRALLLSSAGGEGLDLKGTTTIQVLEPHWNLEKLKQVEGRGIRFRSHSHLPPEKRNVLVQRYIATIPKRWYQRKASSGADEYLSMMSKSKEDLINQFRSVMRQDSTGTK